MKYRVLPHGGEQKGYERRPVGLYEIAESGRNYPASWFSSHNPDIARRILDTGLIDLFMFSINPAYGC